jgi:glycosyltransferase involved in cell wall biosynthesis
LNRGNAVFVFNLLQDVSVLRPLVFLAVECQLRPLLIVSRLFKKRDKSGLWLSEIERIKGQLVRQLEITEEFQQKVKCELHSFSDTAEALNLLPHDGGVIFAGSESELGAHKETHELFLVSPTNYTTVTLQHGYECVGFLHNQRHNISHGRNITFSADVLCGWADKEKLKSMAPSQASKLLVTGATAVLNVSRDTVAGRSKTRGLVCENLHSVRFAGSDTTKTTFLDVFDEFCGKLVREGEEVVLRPHPAGQYVVKNSVPIRKNVILDSSPIYRADLAQFEYGISAPSSIVIDMVLAGIPVGVWQDKNQQVDVDNYKGLYSISSLEDWMRFRRRAKEKPRYFIERQYKFLMKSNLVVDKKVVYERFRDLLQSISVPAINTKQNGAKKKKRILFVSNDHMIATLQICVVKPLSKSIEAGEIEVDYLSEIMITRFKTKNKLVDPSDWIEQRIAEFQPDVLFFCRYSGACVDDMLVYARKAGIPVVFHIDDDLLNIPLALGEGKYKYHNDPKRLRSIRSLLNESDVVYCSTKKLKSRLEELGAQAPVVAGKINCSGEVIQRAQLKPVRKIGYMGRPDQALSLKQILPAVINVMNRHPEIVFEFFGPIKKPDELKHFGRRVRHTPEVKNYDDFLKEFAKHGWDVGICPLAPFQFNLFKSNNKWIEYTSIGAAVIASGNTVYDECCSDGCGLLTKTVAEWEDALEKLISSPEARYQQVLRAQEKLERSYSQEEHRRQVQEIIDLAGQGPRLSTDLVLDGERSSKGKVEC